MIKFLLILPYSNAPVERIFSQLKLIKADYRSALGNSILVALLSIKHGMEAHGCDPVTFEPSQKMLSLI